MLDLPFVISLFDYIAETEKQTRKTPPTTLLTAEDMNTAACKFMKFLKTQILNHPDFRTDLTRLARTEDQHLLIRRRLERALPNNK